MIKKFNDFILEISGTELIGPVGPAYGDTSVPNKTLTNHDTNVIYSDIDDKFYTIDEYNYIYNEHLKKGGGPLNGFSLENINTILTFNTNED